MPPSIFQQIVLPYLALTNPGISPRIARFLSSTSTKSRAAAANTDSSSISSSPSPSSHGSSTTSWEYIPPVRPVSYHTGHDPPPGVADYPELRSLPRGKSSWKRSDQSEESTRDKEVQAFLRKLESLSVGRKETVIMAMERIISIPRSKAVLSDRRLVEKVEVVGEPDRKGLGHGSVEHRKTDIVTSSSPIVSTEHNSKSPATGLQNNFPTSTPDLDKTPTTETSDGRRLSPAQTHSQSTYIPPSVHSLLRSRLYRLAVFHLLQTPEYAVDQDLLDRVAGWMRRDGAGKLARRLERGWNGRRTEGTGTEPETTSTSRTITLEENGIAGSSSSTFSDEYPHRLPLDTWQLPRRSSSSPPSPPPLDPTDRSKALTAAYNAHLSRSLFAPKKNPTTTSSSASSNTQLTSTRPLSRPAPNLAQLRQLILRIEKLEKHRGFKPDWVTANLVVKCWMWCTSQNTSGREGKVFTNGGARSRRHGVVGSDKEEGLGWVELRGIFEFVRRLYEGAVEEQYGKGQEGSMKSKRVAKGSFGLRQHDVSFSDLKSTTPIERTSTPSPITSSLPLVQPLAQSPTPLTPYPTPPNTLSQRISYTRHIRPFTHDLSRAFRRVGDQEGFERVVAWQKKMREWIEGR